MNLKYLRLLSGKTATEIAQVAGFSKQRYCYIENKSTIYSMDEAVARRVSEALGRNIFEICDENVLKIIPRTQKEKELLLAIVSRIKVD